MPPIVSALVSGFVGGVLTIELRARRQNRLDEIQWYDRTKRLAERVERTSDSEYSLEEAIYARNTAAGVLGNLTTHIMHAPSCVSNELLEEMDELAFLLESVTNNSRDRVSANKDQLLNQMQDAESCANSVIDLADKEQSSIGILV